MILLKKEKKKDGKKVFLEIDEMVHLLMNKIHCASKLKLTSSDCLS